MAYENGRQVNRHKAKSKDKVKKLRRCGYEKLYYWNRSETWWKEYTLSGSRTYAKQQTNRRVRRTPGQIPNHAGYRKMFDYNNTIW